MAWDLVTGPDAGMWTAAQVGTAYVPEVEEAIGLRHDGAFVAGTIYEDWNGKSIVAHIAVAGRMTPAFVSAIFDYPFNVCGAHKIICPIPSDNARSINLATKMGFRQEACLKDATPTGDMLLFTLTRSNCRFLEERYGKKSTRAPACA